MQAKRARFFFATERFASACGAERNDCCEQIGIEAGYGSPHIAAKTTEQFDKVKRLYGKTVQQGRETTAARNLSQAEETKSKSKNKNNEDVEPHETQTAKNSFIQVAKSLDSARHYLSAAVNNFAIGPANRPSSTTFTTRVRSLID